MVRGQTCSQLSQVHNQLRSDLRRSLLCLLCCTKHAKAIGSLGASPKLHALRLILMTFLHSGVYQSSEF